MHNPILILKIGACCDRSELWTRGRRFPQIREENVYSYCIALLDRIVMTFVILAGQKIDSVLTAAHDRVVMTGESAAEIERDGIARKAGRIHEKAADP